MYKIRINREKDLKTSDWSGGSTTELAIYPEKAEYNKRDFMWRLSSASIECDESTFTSLPDIKRIILTIDGTLTLEHDQSKTVTLNPFEPYLFNGGWQTKSFGRVKDFNLMYSNDCKGKVDIVKIVENQLVNLTLKSGDNNSSTTFAFYCAIGKVEVNLIGREPLTIKQGDLMIITFNNESQADIVLRNFMLKNSVLIKAIIEHQ